MHTRTHVYVYMRTCVGCRGRGAIGTQLREGPSTFAEVTRGTERLSPLRLSPLSPGWLIRETDAMPGDTGRGTRKGYNRFKRSRQA